MEGGAPKGRRLDGKSGMKKIGGDRLKYAVCESTLSTAARSPFPDGEGSETRIPLFSHCQNICKHMWEKNNDGQSLRRRKRKPTPLRCARQPFPREGARVDTPSFLWKEVPRRGGGWMGKAVFPYQSLPRWGRLTRSDASRRSFIKGRCPKVAFKSLVTRSS